MPSWVWHVIVHRDLAVGVMSHWLAREVDGQRLTLALNLADEPYPVPDGEVLEASHPVPGSLPPHASAVLGR